METLRNVTQYLSLAKTISVAQVFLPSDVMDDIDKLNRDLNTAADTLNEKMGENSVKIKKVFNAVYVYDSWSWCHLYLELFFKNLDVNELIWGCHCSHSALITVAAVMLVLALIGLGTYNWKIQSISIFFLDSFLFVTFWVVLWQSCLSLGTNMQSICKLPLPFGGHVVHPLPFLF